MCVYVGLPKNSMHLNGTLPKNSVYFMVHWWAEGNNVYFRWIVGAEKISVCMCVREG